MPYTKPYLPVPDQLALMKGRGMGVTDDTLAEAYLTKIGYYRLSGYSYPYRRSSVVNGHLVISDSFKSGASFAEIIELYVFDKKLRMLVLDVIERIEIALRVKITLVLGTYGADAHRSHKYLHPNFTQRINHRTGRTHHSEWLRRNDDAFANSKEEFAKHFKSRYPGEDPPLWIAAELWDFGMMSFLYGGMRKADQTAVATAVAVPTFNIMESWLRSLNVTRNICAHHSRLWNKPTAVQPKWPSAAQCPLLAHIANITHPQTRLYGTLCLCAFLLRSINPTSHWKVRLKALIATFPQSRIISLQSAGFPANWAREPLWT